MAKKPKTEAQPETDSESGRAPERATIHIHAGTDFAAAARKLADRQADAHHVLEGDFTKKVCDEANKLLDLHLSEIIRAYDDSRGELTIGVAIKIEATEATVTIRFAPAAIKDYTSFEVDDPSQPRLPGIEEGQVPEPSDDDQD